MTAGAYASTSGAWIVKTLAWLQKWPAILILYGKTAENYRGLLELLARFSCNRRLHELAWFAAS